MRNPNNVSQPQIKSVLNGTLQAFNYVNPNRQERRALKKMATQLWKTEKGGK